MNTQRKYSKIWFLVLLLAVIAAGCKSSNDNGGGNPDSTAPTIISTVPLDLATDVALNSTINISFSEEMSAATLVPTTFTVTQGTTPVSGAVTYAGTTATFTPAGNLAISTVYTATLSAEVKDAAGNAITAAYTWTFTTGTETDTTAPTVSSTIPLSNATGAALNSTVNAVFSEGMSAGTLNATTFTLMQGSTPVSGTVTYVGTTAIFTPASNLEMSAAYTAAISTDAKDAAGNAMSAAYTWTFTTGTETDTAAPTVISTIPLSGATGVALNSTVSAIFSEGMNAATLTPATFTLAQGSTPVSGAVTIVGTTAIFTPASTFASGAEYTATITTGAKDAAGNALAADSTWTFTTGAALDTIAPTVFSTIPVDLGTGVALNSTVNVTFNEDMNAATLTPETFTVTQGTTPVSGTVTCAGATAIFTPAGNLANATTYTAKIKTGAKDAAGNALAAAYTWTFTTSSAVDTTAPTVISTIPADLAENVAINSAVSVVFSEGMSAATLNATTFTLAQGSTPVSGAVTYVGTTATLTPAANFAYSTTYTATLSTGVKDAAGNAMAAAHTWTFTTGTAPDTAAPTVNSTSPLKGGTGVALNSNVNATFSEVMSAATINTATFTLTEGVTSISGAVTYAGTTATFNPASELVSGTTYTATITTGAKDLAGNALATSKIWSFTTGTVAALGPAPVNLGTAGDYVILAETKISTVPTSAITGNLGLSPAAASFITGFTLIADSTNVFSTSTQVTGKIYAANYAVPTPSNLTTAIGDMMIAYTDAAGRTTPDYTELYSGDISGRTLAPGLYKWGTGVSINSDVTLTGGANDVWIFQISGDLTVGSAARVTLAGGALPKNIFWQVAGGTGVAIGTTAHVEGIVLAAKAITVNTGATVNGRLLAQTAVTLISNTIVEPAP